MGKGFKVAALAVAASFLVAHSAAAATYIATFNGTVTSGNGNGQFASIYGSLAGKSFQAIYQWDDSLGNTTGLGTGMETIDGGTQLPPGTIASPVTFASFTIEGDTKTVNPTYRGQVYNSTMWSAFTLSAYSAIDAFYLQTGIYQAGPPLGSGPFTLTGPGYGSLQFNGANLQLAVTDVTVATAVPEPSTWAMMIVGFGMAGSMVRSRRRIALAA